MEDCIKECHKFRLDFLKSLKMRRECIHESAWKLMRCLDFPSFLELLREEKVKLMTFL